MNTTVSILILTAATVVSACSPEQPTASQVNAVSDTASTKTLREASAGMHAGMEVNYTGNPDTDFLQAMIPHHQGAIDMAKAELTHGRDPEVRALAQQVIDAQQGEIAQMRKWLAKRGVASSNQPQAHGGH